MDNALNEPFLIFGMPRSGTTLLLSIIESYATKRYNIPEYFNLTDFTIIDDNKLRSQWNEHKLQVKDIDLEIKNRIDLLQKYSNENMPIKLHSNQITDSIFDYVKNRYSIILIERNEYNQLLSWLVAIHTNIWNTTEEDFIWPEKFIANLSIIDDFFELQKSYQIWKNKFIENSSIIATVYYEDLNEHDNFKTVIEQVGISYDNRFILCSPKKLFSLTEKEELIINLDDVKEYRKKFE